MRSGSSGAYGVARSFEHCSRGEDRLELFFTTANVPGQSGHHGGGTPSRAGLASSSCSTPRTFRAGELCVCLAALTDEDLMQLAGLAQLRRLELDAPDVTDAGVERLKRSNSWLDVVRLERD